MAVVRIPDDMEPAYQPPVLSRREFLDEVFAPHYQAGEHVTFIGPTNSGKTFVAFQMLDRVATPEMPCVVLVMKPKDSTVDDYARSLGFYRTERWPPVTRRDWRPWKATFGTKVRGWIFWPRQSLQDIRRDDKMLSYEFGRAITDCYRAGNRIVFIDEAHAVQNDLKLRPEMDAVLMRGRSLGCSGWFATQRPRHVTLNMYSMAEHLILFRTPDNRDVDVYRQIGGVDPEVLRDAINGLERYEFVYVGRTKGADDEGQPSGDATVAIVKGE